MNKDHTTLSKLSGALFLGALAFVPAAGASSLFLVEDLGPALQLRTKLLQENNFILDSSKHPEMNCGAGKCGSKMGDHTCASVKKETTASAKVTEGKCGEGKCGGTCKCDKKHGKSTKTSGSNQLAPTGKIRKEVK